MSWRTTPLWIILGGSWLAFTAGYVNAVGFLGLHQHGLTHVTGQVTRIGIEAGRGDVTGLWRAAAMVVWFFLGAVLSGVIIQRAELSRRGRRYGIAMLVEAGLLLLATWWLRGGDEQGESVAAMAAGLQNAMATSYSGAVVRTTHMTGIVTDLGLSIGHWLRGDAPEWPKLRLLGALFLGFLAGGGLGALVFPWLGAYSLLPAALSLAVAGIGYFAVVHWGPEVGPPPGAHPPR